MRKKLDNSEVFISKAKNFAGMVGVVVDDQVIFVSVSEKPENLSHVEFSDQSRIFEWISKYRDPLYRHWNREFSDREVLEALSRP